MLVARPDETISPALACTDALKAYGGGVGDGVEIKKFGSVVETVADAAEKIEATTSGDWTGAVALRRGKSPIIGGSLVSMPKLPKVSTNSTRRTFYLPENTVYGPEERSALENQIY